MVSRTRGGGGPPPIAPSTRENLRSSVPPPAVTALVEDLQTMQAEMQKDSAILKQRLHEVEADRDACKAAKERLESDERQNLRGALTNLQQNFQQSIADREMYSAAVKELATTEAKRLELSRQVQELRFQLQQEQAAAAIAAEQHKRDIAKQLQKQAADTVARQAVHSSELRNLRKHAESVQRAADEAARRAATELAAARSDLDALRASLQKERAAFATSGAANDAAAWKTRLRQLKTEMDKVKAERDQLRSAVAQLQRRV